MDAPEFDDLDQAADYVKFRCKIAPQRCSIDGSVWLVWGDGYAVKEDDKRSDPPDR